MAKRRAKVGDIVLVIALEDSIVVGHYLYDAERDGPMVQFYRCPASWTAATAFQGCEALFSPVIVGIWHATRTGRWKVVGHIDPGPFSFPLFLMGGPTRGRPENWWLYDGVRETLLGEEVPKQYQNLETLSGWSAELIEERIQTGHNPFSYASKCKWI